METARALATPPATTSRARVSRQPPPPPASGARSPPASRRAFLGASAASLVASRAPSPTPADVASFVSLDALVANLRDAAAELALIEEALQTSVALGTDPPLKDLKKRLSSGAVADLPAAAVRLDRFIDAPELEDWEEACGPPSARRPAGPGTYRASPDADWATSSAPTISSASSSRVSTTARAAEHGRPLIPQTPLGRRRHGTQG